MLKPFIIFSLILILTIVKGSQIKQNPVKLCNFQNISSAVRHPCQGLHELKIEQQSSQDESFWCIFLDNRNGQYSNQLLKFGFTGGVHSRKQYFSKIKIAPGVVKIAFSINKSSPNPITINSLTINERNLCGIELPKTTVKPSKEPEIIIQQNIHMHITCGTQPGLIAVKLVSKGEKVTIGEYPWHTGLYKIERPGSILYFCGGSLINENTILTAAHCLTEQTGTISADRVYAKLGTVNVNILGTYGKDYPASKITLHPNNINHRHDIALIRLKTNVEYTHYILPICYSNENFDYINAAGRVPGWGLTQDQRKGVSTDLNVASMPGKSEKDCIADNPVFFNQYLNIDYQLCAGNLNGTSICNGDSGGGLVFKVNNKWILRGIVSISPGLKSRSENVDNQWMLRGLVSMSKEEDQSQCDLTQYVVFTDVAKHYDWIEKSLNEF